MAQADARFDVNADAVGSAMRHRVAHSNQYRFVDRLRGIRMRNAANAAHLVTWEAQ
jgi:hypothetical protein